MAVFLCKWEKTDQGWRLWLKGEPRVYREAETYEDAEAALIDAIWNRSSDPDAIAPIVPEYDPPLPPTPVADQYLQPELFLVLGDEAFDIYDRCRSGPGDAEAPTHADKRQSSDSLFAEGICEVCRHGRGGRTDVALFIDLPRIGVDAGSVCAESFCDSIAVYSGRFLTLLRSEELKRLEFRAVETPPEYRKHKFFELAGSPQVSFIGVRGFDVRGMECPSCHYRSFSNEEPVLQRGSVFIDDFVCRSHLPDPIPSCFPVGLENQVRLCMTRQRWDEIRGNRSTTGVMSQRLGIVGDDQCDESPRLWNGDGECEHCRQWIKPHDLHRRERGSFDHPANTCSMQNFQWQDTAAERGLITVVRQTISWHQMGELVATGQKPRKIEIISFRCSRCWRLGKVVLDDKELHLDW